MPLRRLALLPIVIFLTSCVQEIPSNGTLPAVTSIYPTETPPPFTPEPETPDPTFPPPTFPPPVPIASGPINIISIGDDLTRGEGDEIGRGYPGRLLELISQIRPGSTVANFGQPGWTSDDLIRGDGQFSGQLERAVGEVRSAYTQGRGAIVLVWIGENDLWKLYSGAKEIGAQEEEQDAARFSANLETILSGIRETGADAIIALLDDQSLRPAHSRGETYPDISADELLRMSLQVNRYNQIISESAQKHGALTVDFYGSDIFTKSATLAPDGYHPNPAGYDLISQVWYKAVSPILP